MSTAEFNLLIVHQTSFLNPFAFKLTRDIEAAKDLTQETLYRALANRDKFYAGTNIKAWLYTIMRNIFINNYRKNSKQNIIYDYTPNDYLLNQKSLAVIGNTAEINLSVKELFASIQKLPDIFKNPFILYFEGYKYHEISQYLQEPLGTIKSRIHFARKLLKEEISRF